MDSKKILLIVGVVTVIIIGVLLAISLTSKPKSDPTDPGATIQPGETITLEYWGLWESETVMQPLIESYESANPGVNIVYTQKSFNQYEETLYTRLEQGTNSDTPTPDIFRVDNKWLNKFQKYLSPLPDTILSASDYAATFYPTAIKDFSGTDQNIYAIPLEIDGLALFYNKELFVKVGESEPPRDWDSVIELAKKLTIKDSTGTITQAGLAMGTSTNIVHSADIFSLLLLQNGVDINQEFNTKVSLTSQRAQEALDFYTTFATEHEVWSQNLRSDLEMFYSGQLAMMLAPSWRAFDIINSNPAVEFGIAPTPTLTGENIFFSMYWGEAVSRDSQNATEAWKFVKYLSEQDQQRSYYNNSVQIGGRAFGEPYSRKDMASELTSNAYLGAIMTMAPDMSAWKMGEQKFIEEQFRTAINDVAVNKRESSSVLTEIEGLINDKLAETIQ